MAAHLPAELAGEDFAKTLQLSLEYAPAPPFQSGRPELASPEILATVRGFLDRGKQARADAARKAADRLEPTL